ncbi:hypothetical protein ACHAXT_003454 [Thalassiosira profunda]
MMAAASKVVDLTSDDEDKPSPRSVNAVEAASNDNAKAATDLPLAVAEKPAEDNALSDRLSDEAEAGFEDIDAITKEAELSLEEMDVQLKAMSEAITFDDQRKAQAATRIESAVRALELDFVRQLQSKDDRIGVLTAKLQKWKHKWLAERQEWEAKTRALEQRVEELQRALHRA